MNIVSHTKTLKSQVKVFWSIVVALNLFKVTLEASVIVSEIMYHPRGDVEELGEFIEIWNPTSQMIDISGWNFDRGIRFTFPEGTLIGPSNFVIIAKSPEYLTNVYELSDIKVFGPFEGSLANGGERIRLVNRFGDVKIDIRYKDHGDWPAEADGAGHSLIFEDPTADPSNPRNWKPSRMIGGSPGRLDYPHSIGPVSITLIGPGSPGYYFKGIEEPSNGTTLWTAQSFPLNEKWHLGSNGFGYSNQDTELAYIQTQLNDMRGNYIAFYVRLPFVLSRLDLQRIEQLKLRVIYDDGYIAYLNGIRVYANNVNGEPPTFNTPANSAVESVSDLVDLTQFKSLLTPGTNILAFQVHNSHISQSSDCFIYVELIGYLKAEPSLDDPRRSVVINEIYAANAPGEEDWVELYNPLEMEVDLSDCWFSDDATNLAKYKLPQDTVIPPKGYIVLRQSEFGFGLAAGGEKIFLTEPNMKYVLTAYGFGPQTQRIGLARWPDGSVNWFYTDILTPGGPNKVRRISKVVISEIMYHDPIDARFEFIEIANLGPEPIDISGWSFRGITFVFPDNTIIQPGEYIVVADNIESFLSKYSQFKGKLLGNYAGNLDNNGEVICLVNDDDIVVDYVPYRDRDPWPITPDGFGASLERSAVAEDFCDPYQWVGSPLLQPSPGAPSSLIGDQFFVNSPLVITELMYSPQNRIPDPKYPTQFLQVDDPTRGCFVEIYNRSQLPVDLTGWTLTGDIFYSFPSGIVVDPNSYIVVAADPERLRQIYEIDDTIPILGPFYGELGRGGGEVWLCFPNGRAADGLIYDDDFPWPSLADGVVGSPMKGVSLQRLSLSHNGNTPINWRASYIDGATPGTSNHIFLSELPALVTNITIEPFPVTSTTEPIIKVWLHRGENVIGANIEYWIDSMDVENEPHYTLPLLMTPTQPEKWEVYMPVLPANSIVRYKLHFEFIDGTKTTSPDPQRDAFEWHAYFVEPQIQPLYSYPVYHLFISSNNWALLQQWIAPGRVTNNRPNTNWDRKVPAVFVADGIVYDVQVRYQGSRWNRNNGAIISFPCNSYSTDGTVKQLSWHIEFPSYRNYRGIDTLILQKQLGWPQHISFKMFELAGVPVPKTWWAYLQVNGCTYNSRTFVIERPDADMLRRWYGEVGDMFKSEGYTGDEGPWSWGDERLIIGSLYGFTESQRYKYTYDRKTRGWIAWRDDYREDLVEGLIEQLHQARGAGKLALRKFLEETFDIEELLRYICTINYVGTFDDMFQNHFLYRSLVDGKWRIFPWDLDNTLGGPYGEWNANPFRGADQQRINADPVLREKIGYIGNRSEWWNRLKDSVFIAYQEEFLQKFLELNNTIFAPENMDKIIEEAGKIYGATEAEKNQLKTHIRMRHQFLNNWIMPWFPQQPTLQIKQNKRRITVQWPAWQVGYRLQQASSLNGPWFDVLQSELVLTNGYFTFEIENVGFCRFFRLVK